MSGLVVDASAVASWVMPDEKGPEVLLDRIAAADELRAPWLLWVELRNILLMGERRGRLPPGVTDTLLVAVDDLAITLVTTADSARVLALAREHDLTAYDALYLATAAQPGTMLATLDRKLAAAARREGVDVLPDLS